MRQQALALADELAAARTSDNRPPVPEKDITDSVELLRWLADDHFTFLGYRRVPAGRRAGEAATRRGTAAGGRCSAPAWASCARTQPEARALSSMTRRGAREGAGEAAADHHQGQLPGHRAPLGVPRLHRLQDLRRRRRGDRRAALPGAVLHRGVPHQRAGAAGGPAQGRRGAGPLRPEPAQPLRQGPAADPGDLPARRAVPDQDRRPVPRRDRRAADGRPPAAAGVPAPRRVRAVHLLPGLPAPGPVHHRRTGCACRTSCCASSTASGSTTPPGSPSRCWRGCTSSSAPTRPTRPARSTPTCWPSSWPTRPGSGTTTSAWCWSASSATSRPSTSSPATPTPSPSRYKDGHTPYEAMKDLAKLELLEEPGQLEMHLFRKQYPPRRGAGSTRRAWTSGSRSTGTASR